MSTAVRSRVFKISAAAVTAAIAIGLCLFSQDDVSASIKERRVERLNAQIENVYTDEYQQMMDTEIADERDAKERTVDSIYTKVNPYGTNTTSMYVYFTTDQASTVSYTVSAEGYPDYTANAITSDEAAAAYREAAAGDADGSGNVGGTSTASQTTTVSSNDIASTEHEFLVLGLIPKVKNTITLTITDTDGNATTRTIEQTGPKLLGEEEVRLEQAVAPDESTVTTLGNGLYAILGNDSNEQDFMYYYDANGVIRGEIPVLYYRSHRLLFDNDGIMWFSASTKHFVGMNRLGKLVKIINLGDQYILHHDYALDSDGNIVSLATDLKHSDHAVQDQVIKVDTDSGEVSLLVRHNLLRSSNSAEGIEAVLAHPQALAQCQGWLSKHLPHAERRPVSSNAEGARLAATNPAWASISSERAAQQYGLHVVAHAIQDDAYNRTRFAVICLPHTLATAAPSGKDCTSLIISVPNRPGAVHDLLVPLKKHGVSMTRFESRPARTGQWEYYFYIDIEGHPAQPHVHAALEELQQLCAFYKVLGTYPVSA